MFLEVLLTLSLVMALLWPLSDLSRQNAVRKRFTSLRQEEYSLACALLERFSGTGSVTILTYGSPSADGQSIVLHDCLNCLPDRAHELLHDSYQQGEGALSTKMTWSPAIGGRPGLGKLSCQVGTATVQRIVLCR